MPVFIELTTEAFAKEFAKRRSAAQKVRRAGTDSARRPMRGLEIKEDTYAILKVIRADGSEIPLLDSGSSTGTSTSYTNFLIQSVQEARMEKHQIVDTFGEPYIFFFGESPRFLDVVALLISSNDFNWQAEFWANYDAHLRGTRLVEEGARTYLFYDDNIVEGYMLNAQARNSADTPFLIQLTFRLYLTNYSNVSFVGDPHFPVRSSVNLPPSVSLTSADVTTVGNAAITAASDAALRDARINQATTGAAQQSSGFGGAQNLSDALRSGLDATGTPDVDAILSNARQALKIAQSEGRTRPLRSLIADNTDEFTAPPHVVVPDGDPTQDKDGKPEAGDLQTVVADQVGRFGGDANSPQALNGLGLGPNFGSAGRPGGLSGFGSSATPTPSFGPKPTASSGPTGIGGGLGFTGAYTASASLKASAGASASAGTGTSTSTKAVYGNGVPVQGGVSQGTGIGGGIPGGVAGNGGSLTASTGGPAFGSGSNAGNGYGNGLSGSGSSVNVGGAPSAFSTAAVPGAYDPSGSSKNSWSFGPNGTSTSSKNTGIFA
jgi:hypothetical protein